MVDKSKEVVPHPSQQQQLSPVVEPNLGTQQPSASSTSPTAGPTAHPPANTPAAGATGYPPHVRPIHVQLPGRQQQQQPQPVRAGTAGAGPGPSAATPGPSSRPGSSSSSSHHQQRQQQQQYQPHQQHQQHQHQQRQQTAGAGSSRAPAASSGGGGGGGTGAGAGVGVGGRSPYQQQHQQPRPPAPPRHRRGGGGRGRHSGSGSTGGAGGGGGSSSGSDGSGGGSDGDSAGARLPDSPEGPDIVKVSSRSRVSSVAGKIAHDVRAGRLPRIMVAGDHSISTATKAVVQARRYLRPEGSDIGFTPVFRTPNHSRALLELDSVIMPLERGTAADNLAALDNAGGHEARIASSSRHARAGSAAAEQLRVRGISVLCSVGQDALANAVMAAAHAACFLEDMGRQLVVQPVHVVLHRGGQDLHSIKLVLTFV